MMAGGLDRTVSPAMPGWLPNLIAFQFGWWAVVLSAANGVPELGLAVVGVLVSWHLVRVRPHAGEAVLIAVTGLIGLVFDSLLQASGWVAFAGGGMASWLAPLWMTALWVNFATTLNVSLGPLRTRPWLAAALGAVGGPAAYWSGAQLGAMEFLAAPAALGALAVAWAGLTPLLLALATRLSRGEQS